MNKDPKIVGGRLRAIASRAPLGVRTTDVATLRAAAKMLDEHAMLEPMVKDMAERTRGAEAAQREAWGVVVAATGAYEVRTKLLETRIAELEAASAAMQRSGAWLVATVDNCSEAMADLAVDEEENAETLEAFAEHRKPFEARALGPAGEPSK